MGRAVILGCSHAAGAEMEKEPSLPVYLQSFGFGQLNSYPVLAAEGLGHTPENRAISGGSNDSMFRIFTEQLDSLTAADLIVACWTGPDRTEIWHEGHQLWLALTPGRSGFNTVRHDDRVLTGIDTGIPVSDHAEYVNYQQQWTRIGTGNAGRLNKIKNILALNASAADRGIRVINIDSFAPVCNFKWPDTAVWPVDVDFFSWAADGGYAKTTAGHYYLPAHRAYADLILAKLDR